MHTFVALKINRILTHSSALFLVVIIVFYVQSI